MTTTAKVAVVTGAARGIGAAVVRQLAEQGYRLVPLVRNDEDAAMVAGWAEEGQIIPVCGDVSTADTAEKLMATAKEHFGRLDALVNNAGLTKDGLLVRMNDSDWDEVLAVNLKGAFVCSRAAAKVMSKQKFGRIINIASVMGQMGNAGQANYCASKGGLIGLTKSNARELARRNITVNAVAPGFVETDMTAALPEKTQEELKAQIPLGRLGQAQDVAAAVSFLLSDGAGYITGQVLGVNGGMYM